MERGRQSIDEATRTAKERAVGNPPPCCRVTTGYTEALVAQGGHGESALRCPFCEYPLLCASAGRAWRRTTALLSRSILSCTSIVRVVSEQQTGRQGRVTMPARSSVHRYVAEAEAGHTTTTARVVARHSLVCPTRALSAVGDELCGFVDVLSLLFVRHHFFFSG